MFQSVKSKARTVLGALAGAVRAVIVACSIVAAAIIVVPVSVCTIVVWSAGVAFDALRTKRAGDKLVRPQ